MVCLKSLLSRFSVLINYTIQSSDHFSTSSCFPGFLWSRFFGVQCFRVPVFQDPGFSGSRFFRVQVFQGPGFSGSKFFRVQVFQGPDPGFRSSQKYIVNYLRKCLIFFCTNLVTIRILKILIIVSVCAIFRCLVTEKILYTG